METQLPPQKMEHPTTEEEAFEWHMPNLPDYKPEQRIIDDINMRIEYALRYLVTPPIKGEITRGKIRWRGIYAHTLIVDDCDLYNVELADNGNLQNIRFGGHALMTGFSVEPHIFQRDHEINLNFQGEEYKRFREFRSKRNNYNSYEKI